MKGAFFIVGPTATGKSELAADVAAQLGAEIVNGDAFQIYEGFEILTAKPNPRTLAKAPHHLIGAMPLAEEMNAEKFRSFACRVVDEIRSRGKLAIVVGGSGLYLKALTHGLSDSPPGDVRLREELNRLSMDELRKRLILFDPKTANRIDLKNRRRLVRAVEICLLTGRPVSNQRTLWKGRRVNPPDLRASSAAATAAGVFVFRDRDELYERINGRVQAMFKNGALDEVNEAKSIGATAEKMIGLREIREHLGGQLSRAKCVAAIQQATRQYAKRQLTWFRGQTNFEPLNLSLLRHDEAVEWVSRRAIAHRAKG